MDDLARLLIEGNILDRVAELERKINELQSQGIRVTRLGDLSAAVGEVDPASMSEPSGLLAPLWGIKALYEPGWFLVSLVAAGSGLNSGYSYGYKITFEDANGVESTPGTSYGAGGYSGVTTDPTHRQILINVPIGATGTRARRIYRSEDPSGFHIFVNWVLYDIIENNTNANYTDAGSPSITPEADEPPLLNLTSGRPLFPVRATIWGDMLQAFAAGGTRKGISFLTGALGSQYYGLLAGTDTSSADNGDYFIGSVWLNSGNYTMKILGYKASASGKFDVYIDGVQVNASTYDGYAAATTYNVWFTETTIIIAHCGVHKVQVVVNGKNASSSNYIFRMSKIEFYPDIEL